MQAMLVTLLVSNDERSKDVRDPQPPNIFPMSVTLLVLSVERSNEARA